MPIQALPSHNSDHDSLLRKLYTSPTYRPNGASAEVSNNKLTLTPLCSCSKASSELAATYAALILADEGIEITVRPNPHLQVTSAKVLIPMNPSI